MSSITLVLAVLVLVLSGMQTHGQSSSAAAVPFDAITGNETTVTAETQEECYGCSSLKEVRYLGSY